MFFVIGFESSNEFMWKGIDSIVGNIEKIKKVILWQITVSVGMILFGGYYTDRGRLVIPGVSARLLLWLCLVTTVVLFIFQWILILPLRVFSATHQATRHCQFRLYGLNNFIRLRHLTFSDGIGDLLGLTTKTEIFAHIKGSFLFLDHFHLIVVPQLDSIVLDVIRRIYFALPLRVD